MKLTINVTKDDFIEYTKYANRRLLGNKHSAKRSMISNMVIWFFITIIVLSIIDNSSIDLSHFHVPSALITATPLLLYIVMIILYWKNILKKSIPKEDGLLLGDKVIEINDSGITETNNYGTAYYKWAAVESIEEVNGNVYLFFDTMLGYILPRSCFKDNKEREELIEKIKQNSHKNV